MDEPVAPLQLSQKLDDEIAPRSVKNEATPPSPSQAPEVLSLADVNVAANETLLPHDAPSSQLAPPEIDQPLVFDDLDVVVTPAHTSIEDSSSPGTQASVENETQSGKLTVKDALSYLDLVKTTFAEQPDVYNQFLDIMKDFRNQNLDTPQVISGVSDLFSSHPTLIKGFNTFLPPGYHIHCTECADGGTDIITTTPSGTTTTHIAPHTPSSSDGPHPNPPSSASAPVGDLPDAMGGLSLAPSDQSNTNNPGDVTHLPQANNSFPTDAELQSAAQFVGKVKLRFSDEPAIFKQFLVSVQEYQTERRPWQEVRTSSPSLVSRRLLVHRSLSISSLP
ncbi:hypothetical protein DL93DRAFT_2090785 [Clavulina sp. PMI_390]|nr:hypothetical protein DL93DRAFT_2090785 [Clavulina sp. PMI_390]